MVVNAALIELLVCPACYGELDYKDRRQLVICTSCNRHYPVRDGIPVMLVEEATIPPAKGRARANGGNGGQAG